MDDNFFRLIVLSLFLYVPAAIANMAPVVLWRIPLGSFFKKPLDLGMKWRGQPLFGGNKTFFGLIVAVFGGMLGAILVGVWQTELHNISAIFLLLAWGALIGLGAILGDLIKSFCKRRLAIKPGHPFFPWDQIDFVLGAWLAHQFFFLLAGSNELLILPRLDWKILLMGVVCIPPLHLLANIIAYKLRWKSVWW